MTTTTMGLRFRIENSKLVLIQSPPRPSNVASKAIKLPKAQVPKRKGPEKRRKQKQRQLLNICFSREKCPLCSKPLLRKSLPRHLANIHKVEANEVEKMMLKIAKRKSKEVEEEEEDDDDDDDILWLEDEDSPKMEAKKKPRLGSETIVLCSSSESSSSPSSISSSSSLSSCSSLSSSSSSSSCSPPTTSSSSDSDSSSSSPQSSSAEVDISSDSDYYTSESVKVPPQKPLETRGGGGFSQEAVKEKEEVEEDLKYFCHRCNQEFRLPLDLLNHNNFVHRGMRLPEEKANPNPAATFGLSISPSDHSIFGQPFADIETAGSPVINNSIDLLDLDGIDLSFFQEDFSTSPLEDILNFKDDDFYLKELLSSSPPPPPSSPSSFLAGPSQPKQPNRSTEYKTAR